ncbi:hypothetical protein EJ04DRAFT_553632 [Polyplosphaeria fusca]|uniref:Uncharacterized protein n=1 Tax=Polyplosphaeria fusca TaxID=682080 RepID=A0A9P4V1F2_9PLEO|nr:hypothetical protein EJ04DRAFT_553632 [Polyplosphaeria fusca]
MVYQYNPWAKPKNFDKVEKMSSVRANAFYGNKAPPSFIPLDRGRNAGCTAGASLKGSYGYQVSYGYRGLESFNRPLPEPRDKGGAENLVAEVAAKKLADAKNPKAIAMAAAKAKVVEAAKAAKAAKAQRRAETIARSSVPGCSFFMKATIPQDQPQPVGAGKPNEGYWVEFSEATSARELKQQQATAISKATVARELKQQPATGASKVTKARELQKQPSTVEVAVGRKRQAEDDEVEVQQPAKKLKPRINNRVPKALIERPRKTINKETRGEVTKATTPRQVPTTITLQGSAQAGRKRQLDDGEMPQPTKKTKTDKPETVKQTVKHSTLGNNRLAMSRVPRKTQNDKPKTAKASNLGNDSVAVSRVSALTLPANHNRSLTRPSASLSPEEHQSLPPEARFEQEEEGEVFAWRCGIKHCMGLYFNAGDRRTCPGCNTNREKNAKKVWMSFYLPKTSWTFTSPPNHTWSPSRPTTRQLTSHTKVHNGIAKKVFWEAKDDGATEEEALRQAKDAVWLLLDPPPKPEPIREPTPEPTPQPDPIDLGPHPSGSVTMEHGQEIPYSHSFTPAFDEDQFAWRCDANHALGRYYMAGDKRTCIGCGSNKGGKAKRTTMDFFLPSGSVTRQEAPGLVDWQPRRPYKTKKSCPKQRHITSHNQIAAKHYFEAVGGEIGGERMDHPDAIVYAIAQTEAGVALKEAVHFVSDSDSSSDSGLDRQVTSFSEEEEDIVSTAPDTSDCEDRDLEQDTSSDESISSSDSE